MTTATAADFLDAILAEPDRDDLRIIYADWLEENGQAERAEFIRIQCRLANLLKKINDPGLNEIASSSRLHSYQAREMLAEWRADAETLRCRETQLFHRINSDTFIPPLGTAVSFAVNLSSPSPEPIMPRFLIRRGLVAKIACPIGFWRTHGPVVVRCQPVEVVRVSDREPWPILRSVMKYSWWADIGLPAGDDDQSDLPSELVDLLPGVHASGGRRRLRAYFDSPEAAHAALSAACLQYARDAAKRLGPAGVRE